MELWERQPAENDQAYRAFSAYRDAGLHRTFQSSGLPLADSIKLATEYTWVTRTKAYDAWVEKTAQDARKHAIEASAAKIAQDQVEIVSMGLTVAANGIRALLARQAESQTAEIVPANVLVRLAEMSIKAANLLQDKPTDNLKISVADLSPEELAFLRQKGS